MNGLVIMTNGGRMPVLESTLSALGKTATIEMLSSGRSATHALIGEGSMLPFLGDWIALPPPWSAAVSPGAFVLAAGVIWLILGVTRTGRQFAPLQKDSPADLPSV